MAPPTHCVMKWTNDRDRLSVHSMSHIVEPKKPIGEFMVGDTGSAVYPGYTGLWDFLILALGDEQEMKAWLNKFMAAQKAPAKKRTANPKPKKTTKTTTAPKTTGPSNKVLQQKAATEEGLKQLDKVRSSTSSRTNSSQPQLSFDEIFGLRTTSSQHQSSDSSSVGKGLTSQLQDSTSSQHQSSDSSSVGKGLTSQLQDSTSSQHQSSDSSSVGKGLTSQLQDSTESDSEMSGVLQIESTEGDSEKEETIRKPDSADRNLKKRLESSSRPHNSSYVTFEQLYDVLDSYVTKREFRKLKRKLPQPTVEEEEGGELESLIKKQKNGFEAVHTALTHLFTKEEINSHSATGKKANKDTPAKPKFDPTRFNLMSKLVQKHFGLSSKEVVIKTQAVKRKYKNV